MAGVRHETVPAYATHHADRHRKLLRPQILRQSHLRLERLFCLLTFCRSESRENKLGKSGFSRLQPRHFEQNACSVGCTTLSVGQMLLAKSPYLPRHLPEHGTTSVQDGQGKAHRGHHRHGQAADTDFANGIWSFDEVVHAVRLVPRTLRRSWRGAWHRLAKPRSRDPRSPGRNRLMG